MGLIAGEIERRGIPTTCLVLLREIATAVRAPRALFVPFPHGYPLGRAGDAGIQKRVLRSALALLTREDTPVLEDYA